MKIIYLLLFLFSIAGSYSQNAVKITYAKTSNGSPIAGDDPVIVFAEATQTLVTSQNILSGKAAYPFERFLYNRKEKMYIQTANLSKSKIAITIDTTSIAGQNFELTDKTKVIGGYNCKMARTSINSNNIEIWFTNELKVKGAPTILGQDLGLVLELTRNGNFSIVATKIEKLKAIPAQLVTILNGLTVDMLSYRDLLWKSRFTTIEVFNEQIINFSDKSVSDDSIYRYANGTIILKLVKMPVIKKGSRIFADVTSRSNGDAYDRTGSIFIIPVDKKRSFLNGLRETVKSLPVYENGNGKQYQGVVATDDYSPVVELVRFFTPFGVGHFNTIKLKDKVWDDQVYYRQDITEFYSLLSGQDVWIGANIGNYDKGGHKISLNVTVHPEEQNTQPDLSVVPLFNTNNIMEMAGQEYGTMFSSKDGLLVRFTLDYDLENAQLRYISTGHGGWENGDEFVQKQNSIFIDDKLVFSFIPWRTDCGSYRLSNPASGNFNNGLSSSDYSRSNWCPGTITNPEFIQLGMLKKGTHTIRITIPQGQSEGTSFSSWNVSGVLLGEKK